MEITLTTKKNKNFTITITPPGIARTFESTAEFNQYLKNEYGDRKRGVITKDDISAINSTAYIKDLSEKKAQWWSEILSATLGMETSGFDYVDLTPFTLSTCEVFDGYKAINSRSYLEADLHDLIKRKQIYGVRVCNDKQTHEIIHQEKYLKAKSPNIRHHQPGEENRALAQEIIFHVKEEKHVTSLISLSENMDKKYLKDKNKNISIAIVTDSFNKMYSSDTKAPPPLNNNEQVINNNEVVSILKKYHQKVEDKVLTRINNSREAFVLNRIANSRVLILPENFGCCLIEKDAFTKIFYNLIKSLQEEIFQNNFESDLEKVFNANKKLKNTFTATIKICKKEKNPNSTEIIHENLTEIKKILLNMSQSNKHEYFIFERYLLTYQKSINEVILLTNSTVITDQIGLRTSSEVEKSLLKRYEFSVDKKGMRDIKMQQVESQLGEIVNQAEADENDENIEFEDHNNEEDIEYSDDIEFEDDEAIEYLEDDEHEQNDKYEKYAEDIKHTEDEDNIPYEKNNKYAKDFDVSDDLDSQMSEPVLIESPSLIFEKLPERPQNSSTFRGYYIKTID